MNDKTTQDAHHHDDTCTGHTPDVWICQNPECCDKLTADTIGRDGPGEDAGLFCTSCSSRDVRLVHHDQGPPSFESKLFPHQQAVIDQINSDEPNKPFVLYNAPKQAGKSLLRERMKQIVEMKESQDVQE